MSQQDSNAPLTDFILQEWDREVPPQVMVAAEDIAKRFGDHVAGIIFYGSCLRTGEIIDKVLDFYVIVDSYRAAYGGFMLAAANKILPPNVFYHEIEDEGIILRSKYAVLSVEDYSFRVSENCLNVSVWARFCQPAMLLLARDGDIRNQLASDTATAAITMLRAALPFVPRPVTSQSLWVTAFDLTYGAELRSEKEGKGTEIYLLDQARYDAAMSHILPLLGQGLTDEQHSQPAPSPKRAASLKWFFRRFNGKIVSLLRLIKASMTFDGGIDYMAWKISRHSGVEIEVTDRMRKHPVISGLGLFWSLKRKGAFK